MVTSRILAKQRIAAAAAARHDTQRGRMPKQPLQYEDCWGQRLHVGDRLRSLQAPDGEMARVSSLGGIAILAFCGDGGQFPMTRKALRNSMWELVDEVPDPFNSSW